jgi:endonuclease/exonuclease/phosphatase family metal-dependent hydrolase
MMNQSQQINVLSYNIHKGFTATNRQLVIDGIRSGIRNVGAELVFLQEVVGQHDGHAKKRDKWPLEGQFEYLADTVWDHYAYGKNAVYDEGHHGNAILSKYPILSWENIDVSTNTVEARGILHAVISVPEAKKEVHCVCIHLGLLENARLRQIRMLCDRIESAVPPSAPLIIAGDFNDWRGRLTDILYKEHKIKEAFMELTSKHAKTFPSQIPILPVDRIYFRNTKLEFASRLSAGVWQKLSDHIPLLAQFSV